MRTALVERPIVPSDLVAAVADVTCGAVTLFIGTVRDVNDGRPVTGIDYSAYGPMAAEELERIAEEAVSRFGTARLAVEHRIGTLGLGEASIAIAVAHPHRRAVLDAQRYVIEEVKRRVPIWKREHYADGSRAWVDPSHTGGVPS